MWFRHQFRKWGKIFFGCQSKGRQSLEIANLSSFMLFFDDGTLQNLFGARSPLGVGAQHIGDENLQAARSKHRIIDSWGLVTHIIIFAGASANPSLVVARRLDMR